MKKGMEETINRIKGKFPELMVILLCMLVLGVGVSKKEGFHMDELLSFELANAEFNPWIVPTQPEGRLAKFVHNEIEGETFGETLGNLADTAADVLENRGNSKLLSYTADVYEEPVWITAEQFQDYITVENGDDFHYLSVYFNVKDDNHPPLHFMLLHTISSLFRDRAEAWMGCIINMICVAVSMLLLMRLGRLLAPVYGLEEKGRFLGLLAALLYGLSTGCMATTLLIRMYGVVTCLCVSLLYIHVKKWLAEEFDKKNKGLIAITVLGFWTQYFFLFYCLLLAAVIAVLLWCNKRRKELWRYVRSMIIAAVIGIGVYPFALSDVFSSGRGVEALDNLASGLTGYGTRLVSFGSILVSRTFGGLMWVILLILAVVMAGLLLIGRSAGRKKETGGEKGRNALSVILLLPVLGYFLLAARMSPYLVDRYIMPLFPFVILLGTLLLVGMSKYMEQEKQGRTSAYILCVVAIVMQLWGLAGYDGTYLYAGYAEQEKLSAEYAEYPCICVYEGVGYYENLIEFSNYERTLLVTEQELAERVETDSIAALQEVVVLMKSSADIQNITQILEEKYGLVYEQNLYESGVHGDSLHLFVRK